MEQNKKKITNKKSLVIVIAIVTVLVLGAVAAIFLLKSPAVQKILEPIEKSVYTPKSKDLGQPNDDVGVMILSCDNTDELSDARNITVNNRASRYVEGTGAFQNSTFTEIIGQGVFKDMVDISDYKSVHISIYIEDTTKLRDAIWLEFTSAVVFDDDEISWLIPVSKFQNGWNEFYLAIDGAYLTGEPDLESLFYFRMFSIGLEYGTTIIYDNIYATNTEGVVYEPEAMRRPVEPDEYEETKSSEGKMIMSCNTVNIFESLLFTEVTTKKGEFVEGTGAFKMTGGVDSRAEGIFAEKVDISAYEKGNIHLSVYVNDVALLRDRINFELSSAAGKYDVDEYQWYIELANLKNGWNEIWLPIEIGVKMGKPDLSAIDFFRIYTLSPKEGYTIIIDNVYATMESARDNYKETAAVKGKMITSCNTLNTFSKLLTAKVTTVKGEFVEGTGALKSLSAWSSLMEANFKKPVDISAYENGYMNLALYINDTSYLGDMVVLELTSSGIYDNEELNFEIKTAGLKNGWNTLSMPMSKAGRIGKVDLKALDYMRIYTNNNKEMPKRVFIIDNIHVISAEDGYVNEETAATDGKMIASCNTADIFKVLEWAEVTKQVGEYVEGTGALKTKGYSDLLLYGILNAKCDISAYKDGYVHMSFFIDDVSKLTTDVAIELSSSEMADENEYQWNIAKSTLKDGWNELWLGYVTASKIGEPDLGAIKRIRVYTMGQKENLVTIFDNIYATDKLYAGSGCTCGDAIYPGDILKANCLCYFKNAFNMKLSNQSVEGDYALQAKKAQAGIYGSFKKAVDISNYKKGYIHLSVYIDDVSKLKYNLNFELSSSGTHDKNEYDWEIKKNNLKDGWNDIYLSIKKGDVTGTPDLKAINYFRLYTPQCDSGLILRIDNVYASLKGE